MGGNIFKIGVGTDGNFTCDVSPKASMMSAFNNASEGSVVAIAPTPVAAPSVSGVGLG